MSIAELINLILTILIVRHMFILAGIFKSCHFLQLSKKSILPLGDVNPKPIFYVVIPVLREAEKLPQTLEYFSELIKGHIVTIIVVTTARELVESERYRNSPDTIAIARDLAQFGKCQHLHFPDPNGLKSDQLNFAIDFCISIAPNQASLQHSFLLVYDADSRPPLDSLACFEQAIKSHPEVNIFHQSSHFELRSERLELHRNFAASLRRGIADSGALRANRFVLGYELPRLLNRLDSTSACKQILNSFVYTHITGHGLCAKLSLLHELPFPARSPLEDMHYSFLLCSRSLSMVPLASLDCAEVPNSLLTQFQQMTRWFCGPARFFQYLNDPATQPGWRSRLLALSAAGITVEWLSCAFMPFLLATLFWLGSSTARTLIELLVATYTAQLIIVEYFMGRSNIAPDRALRLIAYPISFIIFGIAGWVGLVRLIRGRSFAGKTERNQLT